MNGRRKNPVNFYLRSLCALILSVFAATAMADLQPQGLAAAGIYALGDTDANLTGAGVNIGLICRSVTYSDSKPAGDYRVDTSHRCFSGAGGGAEIKFFDSGDFTAATSGHATAIASILVGFDEDAYFEPIGKFTYEGAVPDANLSVYEFWDFLVEYIFDGKKPQADLLNISLGSAFESWWARGIDSMAAAHGMLVIAAIGNGSDGYDMPLYPAAGANVLAVGVVDSDLTGDVEKSLSSFTTSVPAHSTPGPAIDGRCKPDIVAPGNCLIAAAGSDNLYVPSGSYSSFAAPIVTGVAALMTQQAKADPNLQLAIFPGIGNCMMKSILMTSAKKLDGWHKGFATSEDDYEYPLDLQQGSGMVDGIAAVGLLKAGMYRNGDISGNGWDINFAAGEDSRKVYRFKINDANGGKFTATVVWNLPYTNTYPFEPLWDNCLDLRVELWAVDPASNKEPILLDQSDSPVDNVEHIYTDINKGYSDYELVISNGANKARGLYAVSWQIKP